MCHRANEKRAPRLTPGCPGSLMATATAHSVRHDAPCAPGTLTGRGRRSARPVLCRRPRASGVDVDGEHLMIADGRYNQRDAIAVPRDGNGSIRDEELRAPGPKTIRKPHAYPLLANRQELAERSLHHHRVGEIHQV